MRTHLIRRISLAAGLVMVLATRAVTGAGTDAEAGAVADSALWLPASYAEWMPALRKQAQAVAADAQCDKLLKATLHQSQSTRTHPVFKMICRDSQRQTYSILADGLSGELTYTNLVRAGGAASPALTAALRQQAEASRQRLMGLVESCHTEVRNKTRYMNQIHWVQQHFSGPVEVPLPAAPAGAPPPGSFALAPVSYWRYSIPFDARDAQGNPLYFEAHCMLGQDAPVEVKVVRREPAPAAGKN